MVPPREEENTMRKTSGFALFLVLVLLGVAAWYFWWQRQEREELPAVETFITLQIIPERKKGPSPEFLALEKEIAALVDKIKAADAEHRRLVQEEKKTFPLFDREENLTPGEIAARRQKHAQEQLARKNAVADAGAKLRELNLELKRKRRELRNL